MRAVIATRQEPRRLRMVQLAPPELEEGEVLVRVEATSVSRVDMEMLDGWAGRFGDTSVPGCDAAGVIVGTFGNVGSLVVGDRVATVAQPGGIGSGTYAELVSVPAPQVARVPAGMDLGNAQ